MDPKADAILTLFYSMGAKEQAELLKKMSSSSSAADIAQKAAIARPSRRGQILELALAINRETKPG